MLDSPASGKQVQPDHADFRELSLTLYTACPIAAKDWLLIGLSVAIFGNAVTGIQLFGYGISFLGVMYYNYQKIQGMKASAAAMAKAPGKVRMRWVPGRMCVYVICSVLCIALLCHWHVR